MKSLVIVTMVLIAPSASAQEVIDGSDAALPKVAVSALFEGLLSTLKDPNGSRLRELRLVHFPNRITKTNELVGSSVICGQLNAPNGYGGFNGYQPFWYSVDYREFDLAECPPAK